MAEPRDKLLYAKETEAFRKALECYVSALDKVVPFAGTEHHHSSLLVVELPPNGKGVIVDVKIRFSNVTDLEQLKELLAAATDAPGTVAVGESPAPTAERSARSRWPRHRSGACRRAASACRRR